MKTLLRTLLLLLAWSSAHADPGIWKVTGRHGTVYLMGTIHLRQAEAGLPDNVQRAYRASNAVWLELDLQAMDPLAMQGAMFQRGMLPAGQTLSAMLDARTRVQLTQTAERVGLSPAMLASMRPWLAALTLEMSQYLQQGFSPTSGVDMQLTQQAGRDGKPVHGLETTEQQLDLFATLSTAAEIGFLKQTLQELNDSQAAAANLEAAWHSGNDAVLEGYLNEAMRQDPALYTQLTSARNQRWVQQLKPLLDRGNDTVLVAVGALHLVGRQGLVTLLRQAGYQVTRQ